MKRKFKNKLILLLLAILSLFVFAGCSMGETLEEGLETRGLGPQVTYYANGGTFENSTCQKEIYYSVGSKALNIGVVNPTSGSVSIKRSNFKFVGWYHVTEVVDEEKGLCELGEEVDFSDPLEEDEHWTVAAKWQALVGAKIVMVCDPGATVEVGTNKVSASSGDVLSANSFQNGDTIGELNYDSDDEIVKITPDRRLFTVKDSAYTFYDFYTDEACTTKVEFPLKRGETQTTIYAKYIEGDWTFVETERDVISMFSGLDEGKRYWLRNDVDCSNTTVTPIANFTGEIRGNGFKISNLEVKKENMSASMTEIAMFGNIAASAVIKDVTFENVTMTYKMRTAFTVNAYFVFLSKAAGATVSNVSLQGTMTIDAPSGSVVDNIKDGYTKCLFGGETSDAAYIERTQNQEFSVVGSAEDFITIK